MMPDEGKLIAERMAQMESWISRLAKLQSQHSAAFDKFTRVVREEIAQIYGALLAIDGSSRRIEQAVVPLPKITSGERRQDEITDKFKVADGLDMEVSRKRQRQLLQWTILAFKAGVVFALGGLAKWIHEVVTR